MAKRPGAGGIMLVAVVLGLITAYLVYGLVRDAQKKSEENWKPVVVAKVDIPPKKIITREMVDMMNVPPDHIVPGAVRDFSALVGTNKNVMSLERIRMGTQIREDMVVKEGQGPSLTYEIPPGKRAIAIKVDEVSGVGATVMPDDHVDILATFTDVAAKQEITQMILQNVLVLAINRGQTEANAKGEGASSSITLAVSPEEAELLTAADRTGVLRVMLRPVQEEVIVASQGIRAAEIGRGRFELSVNQSTEEPGQTPVQIISPQRDRAPREPMTIYRGTQASEVPKQ